MAVLINDDFSADTSANYNGAGRTITGGQCNMTGSDGFRIHSTSVSAGDRWFRIRLIDNTNSHIVCPGVSAAGTGFGIVIDVTGANVILDWLTNYTTYTTYDGVDTDVNVNCGTRNVNNFIGFTVDTNAEIIRVWNTTTAAEPTTLALWDGAGPTGTLNFSGLTNHNITGAFVGFGTWDTSGTPVETVDDFSAGTIGAAQALLPSFAKVTNVLLRQ